MSSHQQRMEGILHGIQLQTGFWVAVSLYLYDWALTSGDELQYIWGRWALQTKTKALFLFMRYFPLAIHILRKVWITRIVATAPVAWNGCMDYFILEILWPQIQIFSVDIVLLLSVWVLFRRAKWVLMLLAFLLVMQIGLVCLLIFIHLPDVTITTYCMAFVPAKFLVTFSAAVLFFQTIAWLCTAYHYRKALEHGWGRSPLIRLLMRDGTLTWFALTSVVVFGIIIYTTISTSLFIITNSWIISVMSIAGCRIIINMQHLAESLPQVSEVEDIFELTTRIQPGNEEDRDSIWIVNDPLADPRISSPAQHLVTNGMSPGIACPMLEGDFCRSLIHSPSENHHQSLRQLA